MHFILFFTNWLPDNIIFLRLRGFLARPFFNSCGKNLRIGRDLTFYNCGNISIGCNVYIARSNWFSAGDKITIGDEVIFGPMSSISASNHTSKGGSFRYGKPITKPINIEKGTWISAHCAIIAGVNIGENSLIGANTVVSKNVPKKVLFAGNPGKVVKHL